MRGKRGKRRVEDAVPTTVEQAIPLYGICEDGISLVGRNQWSKSFRFSDINYSVASGEETKNEKNNYREISIFKDGIVL